MKNSKLKTSLSLLVAVLFLFTLPACLKTRTQIKKDKDEEQPQAAQDAGQPKGGYYEIEEIKGELARVSGKVEELDRGRKSDSAHNLPDTVNKLNQRVDDLEKNQVLIMSELKSIKDSKEQAKKNAVPVATLLKQGFNHLKDKENEEALESFNEVTSRSEKGKDAAEAFFGAGEADFSMGNYKKAILSYSKVQEAFAKSPRIPTSLYNIGLSFQKLNMSKEAKGFYSELIERFPKSPEAKKAKAKKL